MSTATVLDQIHALPPAEREQLFDALWPEASESWRRRQREDEEDNRSADDALRAWDGKTAHRLEDVIKRLGDVV